MALNSVHMTVVVFMIIAFVLGFLVASVTMSVPMMDYYLEAQPASLTGAVIQRLPCMDTSGCVKTDIDIDTNNIFLPSGCYRLDIPANQLQTYSISNGIKGIRQSRPNSHDVIQDMIEFFEMEPLIVKINSYDQGTYFAKMAFNHGTTVLDMDITPGDAIAIAVRTNTPVWVNQNLMELNGEYIC